MLRYNKRLVYRLITSFSTAITPKANKQQPSYQVRILIDNMSSRQMPTKRPRKTVVSVAGIDVNELKPRVIDHPCVSRRHCSAGPQLSENPKEKLSSLKTGRSLCDQEPFNTQESTQCLVWATGLKRLFTYRIWERRRLLVCRKDRRKTQTNFIRRQSKRLQVMVPERLLIPLCTC